MSGGADAVECVSSDDCFWSVGAVVTNGTILIALGKRRSLTIHKHVVLSRNE